MTQQNIKYRSKLSAFLLALTSFLIPGIGQIFGGRMMRALVLFSLVLFLSMVSAKSGLLDSNVSGIIMLSLVILFALCIAVDAYKINSRKDGVTLQWYNKWYYYTALVIFSLIINFFSPSLLDYYKSFNIPTNSNIPTLQVGDRLLAKISSPSFRYKTGSIVIFTIPERYGKIFFIKRIVAQAGDTYLIKNGISYLNGRLVQENYISSLHPGSINYGPIQVPSYSVLVLNDNRDDRNDSRKWGTIPQSNIQSTALYIYFSWNLKRIGLKVD
ncbi:MAG: signal peptidase I [Pseudomonadota bacterium]|nr:signal peptidase I [Pseudomonadota bacterium]